jgi:hypothetical protein
MTKAHSTTTQSPPPLLTVALSLTTLQKLHAFLFNSNIITTTKTSLGEHKSLTGDQNWQAMRSRLRAFTQNLQSPRDFSAEARLPIEHLQGNVVDSLKTSS